MKIKDYVSREIQTYPSLYKSENYEISKLKVLSKAFFLGTAHSTLAWTENPTNGGYIVTCHFRKNKKTNEWVRVFDKPYGQEKFKELPDSYFEDRIFYVNYQDKAKEIFIDKRDFSPYNCLITFNKIEHRRPPMLIEAKCNLNFTPDSINKDYSAVCKILYAKLFLQDDWKEALSFLCQKSLDFFENETQYKSDFCYPTEKLINREIRYFNDAYVRQGAEGVVILRKSFGYNDSDILPNFQEIETRKWQSFENHKNKQIEFLKEFLSFS